MPRIGLVLDGESAVNISLLFYFLSDATVYVGGLDDKVSEAILWELFLQAGPVGKVSLENIQFWCKAIDLSYQPYLKSL